MAFLCRAALSCAVVFVASSSPFVGQVGGIVGNWQLVAQEQPGGRIPERETVLLQFYANGRGEHLERGSNTKFEWSGSCSQSGGRD